MKDFNIKFSQDGALKSDSDTIISFRINGERICPFLSEINKRYNNLVKKLEKRGEISTKYGRIGQFYINGDCFKKVYVVGLGDREELQFSSLKNILAEVIRMARDCGSMKISVDTNGVFEDSLALKMGKAISDVMVTSQYRFEKYLQKKGTKPVKDFIVHLTGKKNPVKFNEGVEIGKIIGDAVNLAKDLCNEPSNYMTPVKMAETAREIAKNGNLGIEVLGPEEMKKLGMELILAVSKGSVEEPRVIVLEYKGNPRSKKNIGILGKGITFDAGGINLKKGNQMFQMKRDMTGGAIVLSIMKALSILKPAINCVAIVPASENMPQGNAYKPGDIYKSMSGKFVEIINTDAEGRLIMADAMTYIQQQYKLDTLIDIATLTTGARIAIGSSLMSIFANNDGLYNDVKWAGRLAGEEVWRLPLYQKYKKGVRSYFSDLKNTTFTPPGSIKAALFLEDFLEENVKWVHFDIASVDSSNKEVGVFSRGATVAGLRSIANYLLYRGGMIKKGK